ncbi:MAG: RluA family pseudouridine synthase [Gaiella sp.]|nr:RluA family pseudouridine synthase [Gaiella sp.]
MARHRFRVPDTDAGRRLDAVLAEQAPLGTRALAERLVAGGAVLVDGTRRAKSYRLAGGEEVTVDLPAERVLEPVELELPVVFEDEHLLVIDKPAGLVAHPAGPDERTTLAHGLLALGAAGGDPGRPGLVHRLDRDTSGLLVVARSEEAHARLSRMIRERTIERWYLALVRGRPRSLTGRITAPIGRDRQDRTRYSLDTDTPRDAVTWFEVVELIGDRALLGVRLETGRTHQIRVHLEAIELPVCGDPVYGIAHDLGLERQFLHAHRLRFAHPFTGESVDLQAPLPPALDAALRRARESS